MLYCATCQLLVREGERCPVCGSRKLREAEPTDPVLLMTSDRMEAETVLAAFKDKNIPCEQRDCGIGAPPAIVYGRSPQESVDLFVPFEALDRCREILEGMGILDEKEQRRKKDATESPEEPTEPMSPARKAALRIASAVAFLLLIWLAVSLSDNIVYFVKTMLHLQ